MQRGKNCSQKARVVVENNLARFFSGSQFTIFHHCSAEVTTLRRHKNECISEFGERAFSHAGPAVWNSLPPDIRAAASSDMFRNALF